MKNKVINKFWIIAFFGIFTGCSDFLEEDPRGLLTPDTFFQNEEETLLAVNKLNESVGRAGFLFLLGTDLGVSGRITLSAAHRFGAYAYDSGDNRVNWDDLYASIRDANSLLASMERSTVLSDEVKGVAIAQAKFFRAFQYINLVTIYEDVPYIRDELVDIEEVALIGQTDGTIILSDMIDDLDQAITSGFLSTDTWGDNDGRPTVWTARMLKAHAHVWLEEWEEARTELIEITTNSPHQLSDDYADKYREGNEIHPEIIFGLQKAQDILSDINTLARPNLRADPMAGPAFDEVGVSNGSAPETLRKSFADTYDDADARRIYNVWDNYTLEGTTEPIQFAWTYIPRLMRGPVPVSDPLFEVEEATNNSSQPNRIFLLADAYLLLAESEFMIGGSTAAALAAINTIRERAQLPDLTTLTMADIRNERAWELVGEGYWGRKRDLIRWGILDETVLGIPAAEMAAGATEEAISRAQAEADIIAAAPAGRFEQYPVPLAEILQSQDIGGALVQHPLWAN